MAKNGPGRRRIARLLIINLVLFSSVITLVTTSIQLYREYQRDLEIVDQEVDIIRTGYLSNLRAALWALDSEQAQLIVNGIGQVRDILGVVVVTESGMRYVAGDVDAGGAAYVIPVVQSYRDEAVTIGELRISIDLRGIYARLFERFWTILLSNGVKTFAVSIFVFLLFQRLITRHLVRIADYAKALGPDNLERALSLDRAGDPAEPDEIDTVANAINEMRTNLRRSYMTLAESEEQFRQLAENIDAVLWIGSPDWQQVHYVSPAYERVWGRPRESLYEAPASWLNAVHEDDRQSVMETIDGARAGLRKGPTMDPQRVEFPAYRVVHPDGSVRTVEALAFPVWGGDGSVLRVVGLAQDVTERVEAERRVLESREEAERARALLMDAAESIPVTFELYDADDRLLLVNNRALEFFPQLAPVLKPGVRYGDVLSFVADHGLVEQFGSQDSVRETRRPWVEERLAQHANPGVALDFEWTGGRWFTLLERRTSDGGSVVATVDISDRREIERQLAQAQKMEAVGQLTGGFAHDFNNILGAIVTSLDLVDDDALADDAVPHVRRARRAAERGAGLTARLLAFARKQPLRPVPVNVAALLDDMADLLGRALGEQIDLKIAVDPGIWTALVDPNALENAVLNLALNAHDAMPGGGSLAIEAGNETVDDRAASRLDLAPGDYLVFAVRDTGAGMPPDIVARAIEPFYSTKPPGEGTGLGLSMVLGFAVQSGGQLRIESEVGRGTSVQIYLPRHSGGGEVSSATKVDAMPDRAGGETILVVEDDAELRTPIIAILESLGYRVLAARDGADALAKVAENPDIALLLTDVVLPGGMDGRQLSHACGEQLPQLQVLYMSGYPRASTTREGRPDDDMTLIQKPFRKAELAAAVRETLSVRQRPRAAGE